MSDKLTAERLRELLSYNADTGVFTYRLRRGCRSAGAVAGCMRSDGYTVISVDTRNCFSHRLVWLYVTGSLPAGEIDHIDGDRSNNRIANLRDVSPAENSRNLSLKAKNTSGYQGVTFYKKTKRWMARIRIDGKQNHIGFYDTPEAAHAAYARAAEGRGYTARHIYGEALLSKAGA